jgi:hypothetical protein
MTHHRFSRFAALGLALAALAGPSAAAADNGTAPPPSPAADSAGGSYQDLRSPDARDAARAAGRQDPAWKGLRPPLQDTRLPDTRDAAAGRGTFNSPEVTVVKVPQASPAPDGGLDWGDAGIGAGGLLGLILLGLGGILAVMHRRQSERRRTATIG